MALGRDIVDAIIREHRFRPIAGDVLLIGQQTVSLSRDEVLELMREHGVAPCTPPGPNDAGTSGTMSAAAFFGLLGATAIRTLDAAAGADIIHDVAHPVPEYLKNSAEFIVDGGALADMFSPAMALRNYANLLRPGGRLISINNWSGHFDPYSIQSAAWNLDYFAVNNFVDCKAYVLVYPPDRPTNAFCIDIDCLLDPKREVRNFLSPHEMAVVLFAEKGAASTSDKTPIHGRLRSSAAWERYRQILGRIKLSARPHLVRSRGDFQDMPIRGGHLFMRTDYAAVEPLAENLLAIGSAAKSADPTPSALRVLCVGTGRDGTQSVHRMMQHVFAGTDRKVMHEYCCREFYQAFCDFKETGDHSHEDALKRMVADCSYDCIVGNGYAALLPLFAQHYGRGLKIVHLQRTDRDACIASLIKNAEMFPTAYRNYSKSPDAVVKRMAAFHFGEMSHAKWDRLSIEDKFGWYYDKTHALVREHLDLFDHHMEVSTESLDDEACRRAITVFVDGGSNVLPPKAHLNASVIDIASFPKEQQQRMHWLMGRLNIEELAADEVYGLDYFLDKFIARIGYQIAGAMEAGDRPVSAETIAADLERAEKVVNERLKDIKALRQLMRDRAEKGPSP